MRKFLLFILVIIFASTAFTQQRAIVKKELRNIAVERQDPFLEPIGFIEEVKLATKSIVENEEEVVGNTYFDLQSNSAMQNRIYLYDDGTIGATYTFGVNYPNFLDDRGTGYNYFDGNAWGPYATARVETDRTGWPAYAPWGENGEIICAHISGGNQDGLLLSTRPEKGTGDWAETLFQGPTGGWEGVVWPRMTTTGPDNSIIHMIYLTRPTANGGTIYEGQDGALLYSRSNDGGATWSIENHLFEELDIDYYLAFDGDTYEIQADGDNVAILIGEPWIDLVLLKSTDGGESWTKTIVWENPYPFWSTGTITDTFYCVDGSHSIAFDSEDKVHVAFGINRGLSVDGTQQSWFPYVDGVGYWNEDRPVFSNNLHALDPYGHEDSELIDDYSLIGYSQDIDGDGEITLLEEIGTYQLGLSSMPQIHIDDMGMIWIVWSSVTETYDNGSLNYRHIWMRRSPNGGEWWSWYNHLTSDLIHIFDECVWPALSITSDQNYVYMLWQADNEPGLAERFTQHTHVENLMYLMEIEKYPVGVEESPQRQLMEVSHNLPNPFHEKSVVTIKLEKSMDLEFYIHNLVGQKLYSQKLQAGPGLEKIEVDAERLNPGIYFYTVKAGLQEITHKMIVE